MIGPEEKKIPRARIFSSICEKSRIYIFLFSRNLEANRFGPFFYDHDCMHAIRSFEVFRAVFHFRENNDRFGITAIIHILLWHKDFLRLMVHAIFFTLCQDVRSRFSSITVSKRRHSYLQKSIELNLI